MISILKDLRSRFGVARDQGQRSTCTAFAVSDSHAASRPPYQPLSVEYLYCNAINRSFPLTPDAGISLTSASEVLRTEGQPIEVDWPYLDVLPADLTAWRPPHGLQVFRKSMTVLNLTISEICVQLDQDVTPILVLKLSEAFLQPDDEGVVVPASNDPDTSLHAVVAVGYGTSSNKRMILVRNSWGEDWGLGGYAWLPEGYLLPRLRECALLT